MKRSLLLLVLALWTASAQAGSWWDNLWRNADQQGERLLQRGDTAAAAQTFSDPRRKAYAELQDGDFANAAKHFSAFDDSNGNYNRGNALAQSGQLQEALKAYDAALAHDPNDQDARHNRELVAKALQQQTQSSSNNKSPSKAGKENGKTGQSGNNSGNKDSGKQGEGQKAQGSQNPSGQNQNGKEEAGKPRQDKQGNSNTEQNNEQWQQSARNDQAESKQQPGSSNPGNEQRDEAAQAKRDAAAALGKAPAGETGFASSAPLSEQQLAQEQWLRAIPDDPGGLLRRKFMIEHMIRQQGGQR